MQDCGFEGWDDAEEDAHSGAEAEGEADGPEWDFDLHHAGWSK